MERKPLYKYIYKGTTERTVLGRTVRYIGDSICIPIKNFTHPLFESADGGKNFPKPVSKLKDKGKGKKCLIIGNGPSAREGFAMNVKNTIVMAVNPSLKLLRDIKPDYVLYLENNYAKFINRNIKLFEKSKVIGNDLALNCEHVDYHYGEKDVVVGLSSGFYALQIADKIMGFKEINLIGYDYYGKEYDEKLFKAWLLDFDKVKWKSKIINLNKKSKLQIGGKSDE